MLYLKTFIFLCLLVNLLLVISCDQVTRHKVLTTVFDGVPELPPVDDLCQEYVDEVSMAQLNAEAGAETAGQPEQKKGSSHPPYAEKNCSGCHQQGAGNELIKPARELCFVCHVDFIEGPFVHGPVAVADCLACHLPHSSSYKSLLVKGKSDICSKCHREERLATAMHDRLSDRGMACVECHGAHFGKNQYFLK